MRNSKGQFTKGHPKPENAYKFKKGHIVSDTTGKKISLSKMGHPVLEKTRKKIAKKNIGKKQSEELKIKRGIYRKGKKSPAWKGASPQKIC